VKEQPAPGQQQELVSAQELPEVVEEQRTQASSKCWLLPKKYCSIIKTMAGRANCFHDFNQTVTLNLINIGP